ncbi:MAG: hypothetical protein WCW13_05220 [archaeon]|jgi:hypothetical protein
MNSLLRSFFTVVFGFLGIVTPFASIFAATFMGKSDLATINSTMLMVLSILLIVFLVINCFNNFNNNSKKMFIIGIILFFLSIVSFVFNLSIFVALP